MSDVTPLTEGEARAIEGIFALLPPENATDVILSRALATIRAMQDEFAKLQTPEGVLINMLRGSIAKPELRTVLHAYRMLAEYDAQAEALKAARDGLERAAGWFRGYGEGHAKKGDGDKAQRNFDRADACNCTIAKIDALQAEALK